ncbi:hypothetical protein Syun_007124 [Stephania yunnanensis]|uniref:Uncharacterized protein n=1 Tax=Stephania yunnanensis TaxID=152371 RepID=A0AAP0KXY9_9MAGN
MAECLTNLGGGSAFEEKLRHTHVILEAFGNVKASKEANSSQFWPSMTNLFFHSHLISITFENIDKLKRHAISLTSTHNNQHDIRSHSASVRHLFLRDTNYLDLCSKRTQLFFGRSLARVPEKDKSLEKGKTNIPSWLSPGAQNLIMRILDPNPITRITNSKIKEDGSFNQGYIPSTNHDNEELEDDFRIKDTMITLVHTSHYLIELNKSHGDSSLYRQLLESRENHRNLGVCVGTHPEADRWKLKHEEMSCGLHGHSGDVATHGMSSLVAECAE